MLENLLFRPPTPDDAEETLALMIRCDISEYGEPDSEMEELVNDWENIDLEEDAWLAFDVQNKLIGYAAITPWGEHLKYDMYVEPDMDGSELVRALLVRCEERGAKIAETKKFANAVSYIAHVDQQTEAALVEAGFQTVSHVFNMQATFDAPPPAPKLPKDMSIRTVASGEDYRKIHEVIQSAFDRPGRTPQPFDEWKNFMMRPNIFKPDLWFLAMSGTEIVGTCLCFEYSETDTGWVRQLGVLEPMRRTGLGSALLQHAFVEFYNRGFKKVGLAVSADNLRAISFYENAGMKQLRRYDEYVKAFST